MRVSAGYIEGEVRMGRFRTDAQDEAEVVRVVIEVLVVKGSEDDIGDLAIHERDVDLLDRALLFVRAQPVVMHVFGLVVWPSGKARLHREVHEKMGQQCWSLAVVL